MLRYAILGLAVSLCGLMLLGCDTSSSEKLAEKEVIERANYLIGPADMYEADVTGITDNHVDQVRLRGYGVRPTPDNFLNIVAFNFSDVGYQSNPFRITSVGSTRFAIQVSDTAVDQNIARRLQQMQNPPIRDPDVTFLNNEARVAYTLVGVGNNERVTTVGTLVPQGATVLYQRTGVMVGGEVLTPEQIQTVNSLLNPIIDLSSLPSKPQITNVLLRPGVVTLAGTANVNNILQQLPR